MLKEIFIVTGMLVYVLAAASQGVASDRKTAPAGAAQEKPAAQEDKMVMFVKYPSSSKVITVPTLSTVNADLPVAEVNGERITVNDLRSAIGSAHEQKKEAEQEPAKQASRIDMAGLLQRLINVELMVQEARNIGLDELPEAKNSLDTFSQVTLRDLLRQDLWKNVSVSEDEVDKEYKEAVREVRTSSAFFEKKADANKAAARIKSGKKFEEVIAKAIKAGTAKGAEEGNFIKFRELNPAVSKALATMKIGSVGPVTRVELKGKPYFALFRYEAEQFPENSAAREQARKDVMNAKRVASLGELITSLSQKNVITHKELFKSLDYGPKGEGLEKLMNDQRVVAEIKGDKPVTVSQLSEAMQDKFYHGTKNLKGKRLDQAKQKVLESLVQKRLLYLEALNRGIDKSKDYKDMLKEYERNIVFGLFVQQVVAPGVAINEDDQRAYYREHAAEYMSEPLVKIAHLAFLQKADALWAMDRMKKGADFGWVRANAAGQAPDSKDEEPAFGDDAVPLSSLTEDVRSALAGVKAEDVRLYEGPKGRFYVLYVAEMIPPQQLTFEQVRGSLTSNVYYAKLNKAVAEWARKLKESADIRIYLVESAK
jgi:hypothetical protein